MKRAMVAAVLALALTHVNFAYGQGGLVNGTVQGRVLDSSGAVIPGAALELTEVNKGTKSTTLSDSTGLYFFGQVSYGSYSLTVRKTGFADTTVTSISITAKEVENLDVTLTPGTVIQTVQVSASALTLETQSSDIGQDVVPTIITSVPIAHRNVFELAGLVPGVVATGTNGGSTMSTANAQATWQRSNFTVGGGFGNNSSFLIDGVDQTHSFGPGASSAMVFLGPDSVEEFRLHLFDYPADLPRGSGILSLVSKSGTNAIHGDVFYYHQNSALNASDFMTNSHNKPIPPLRRHEFGGAVGGPVVIPKLYNGRNKTFFFFDFDQIRQPLATNFQARMPTAAERQGDFSNIYSTDGNPVVLYNPFDTYVQNGVTYRRPFPNNVINLPINQFATKMMSYYPNPNSPTGILAPGGLPTQQNNFFLNPQAPYLFTNVNIRIDEALRQDLRFMFHYIYNPPPVSCTNPYATAAGGGISSPINCNHELPIFESGTINWSVTPHLILNINGNWMDAKKHIDNLSITTGTKFDLSSLGGPYSAGSPFLNQLLAWKLYPAFPSFNISGYGGLGSASIKGVEATGGGQAGVIWTKGSQTLKFGFQFFNRPVVLAYATSTGGGFLSTNLGTTGQFTNGPNPLLPDKNTGNALADLELGLLGSGVVNQPSLELTYRDSYYAWYGQDDWRVTPKLTLNLGLRYDFDLSFRERRNYTAVFNPNFPNPIGNFLGPNTGGQTLNQALGRQLMGGYVFAGSPLIGGRNRPASTDFSDISPRVGFAYAQSSKLVWRGSFGRIYFPGIGGVSDNGNCPSCTGVTPLLASIDGINPNPAVTLNNPFSTGFNQATGNTQGLLTGVGLPLTEAGAAYPVTPFAWQFSGGFERQLPANIRLSLSYVGSRGRHLAANPDCCNDQLPLATAQQYGASLNNLVPNPFYGIVTNPTSILSKPTVQQWRLLMNWPQFTGGSLHQPAVDDKQGFPLFTKQYPFTSSWNALLLSFEKRFSGGLELLVSYTWSKNLSNVTGQCFCSNGSFTYQDIYNVEHQRSVSVLDVPQRLVFTHVYQLPFGKGRHYGSNAPGLVDKAIGGWELGGYLVLASGTPLTFSVTPNNSNTHSAALFPNLTCSPHDTVGSRGARVQQWFNTSCFAAPAPFTYGNAPLAIASVRNDGIKNYDMTLSKWFPIKGEALKMQLRADAFNLFNRTQFGNPNTQLGSASFGVVSSVFGPPRFIQLGARLQW